MWDQGLTRRFGRLSLRNGFILAAAIMATCLAYILLGAPATHAAPTASWQNGNIVYQNNEYSSIGDAKKGDGTGLAPGTHLYVYLPNSQNNSGKTQKAQVIYFAPGVSPPEASSADHTTYDFTSPDTFSHQGQDTSIDITPSSSNPGTESCANKNLHQVGWWVCPVTNFLAGGMDTLFNLITSFLQVRPAQTTTDNALYRAWSYMRTFANIAFVIAFLVIIYSQLTSMGVSNYGIKKLLPRLIIAAILVNVSYWICAVAIDVSNILGYSVQDLFIYIRNHLVGNEGDTWANISWVSLSGLILGGTATSAAIGGIIVAFGGAGAGVVYLLLPILVGVLTAALVALIILAARQAIITVMVVLAPLAFVAYLLPNTEKYFGKWREIFMTMLLVFPIFSVIFGGAQLAGAIIIQNSASVTTVLFGMAVQVAPVVITPLLIRFSGSIIGRIASMINNPKKGLVDRTRNFSQDRMANHQAQRMKRLSEAQQKRIASGRKPSMYSRAALYRENSRRKREGLKKANEAYAEATWENSDAAHAIHNISAEAGLLKEQGETAAQAAFERLKHTDARIQALDQNVRVNKLKLDVSKAAVEANWEELKAGSIDNVIEPTNLSQRALTSYMDQRRALADTLVAETLQSRVEARRAHYAQEHQSEHYTDVMQTDQDRRLEAAGIAGTKGAESVLANAIAEHRKTYATNIGEKAELAKHFNLSSAQYQQLALGTSIPAERKDAQGNVIASYTFDATDDYTREAAISNQLAAGSEKQKYEILMESGIAGVDANGNEIKGKTYNYRTSIQEDMIKNNFSAKMLITGSRTNDDVRQGRLYGRKGLDNEAVYHIMQGKISDDVLARQGDMTLNILYETYDKRNEIDEYINADADGKAAFERYYQELLYSAHDILEDKVNRNYSEAAKSVFERQRVKRPDEQAPPAGTLPGDES